MINLGIFREVYDLAALKRPIKFFEVPEVLRDDLREFVVGKTLVKIDGHLAVYSVDMQKWIQKIKNEGIGYSINLNGTPEKVSSSQQPV